MGEWERDVEGEGGQVGEWEWDVEGEGDRWGNGSGMLKVRRTGGGMGVGC